MTASVRKAGERLELAGRVTADNVAELRRQGESWLAERASGAAVTIDLSSVSTASSLLLSLLLCWHRAASRSTAATAATAITARLHHSNNHQPAA